MRPHMKHHLFKTLIENMHMQTHNQIGMMYMYVYIYMNLYMYICL